MFLIKFEYLFILKALPENFDHFGVSNQNLSSYVVYNKALPEIVDNFGIFYHYLSFEFKWRALDLEFLVCSPIIFLVVLPDKE